MERDLARRNSHRSGVVHRIVLTSGSPARLPSPSVDQLRHFDLAFRAGLSPVGSGSASRLRPHGSRWATRISRPTSVPAGNHAAGEHHRGRRERAVRVPEDRRARAAGDHQPRPHVRHQRRPRCAHLVQHTCARPGPARDPSPPRADSHRRRCGSARGSCVPPSMTHGSSLRPLAS